MRVAASILLTATLLSMCGCGRAEPEFAYNQRTEQLQYDVSEAVKGLVRENFGTPTETVAWLRMPVDYGTVPGTIEEVLTDDPNQAYRFRVELAMPEGSPIDEERLDGLGLQWLSGTYGGEAGFTVESEDGQADYVGFQVRSYDPQARLLTLKQALSPPPAAGDTFAIMGHQLSYGRTLYAQHCQHCHGVSGDGNGPTAKYLNPLPRDYRRGIFKFKSTPRADRARRDDLKRVISQGIPGTYMPSFLLLEEEELEAIVEYVRWLSMRGEYELALVNNVYSRFEKEAFQSTVESRLEQEQQRYDPQSGEPEPTQVSIARELVTRQLGELPGISDTEADFLGENWERVKDPSIVVRPNAARVPDTPDSRARGRVHFMKNCAACHGAMGRGNGPQTEDYMENKLTGEKYEQPGLFDDWGNPISPRDLTRGIYRGGRRPVDLYRRVVEGINGTPMPPFKGKMTDEQIWDLVNYVMYLPFQAEQPATAAARGERRTAAVQDSRE